MNKALVAQIREALEAERNRAGNAACETSSLSRIAELRAHEAEAENALRCLDALIEAEKHNGYTNYETFLVKLAIDNDGVAKDEALQMARDHSNEGMALADALKDYIETWTDADVATENSLGASLMGAAFSKVNWRELADDLAEEIAEGVE